jgi:ABC-type transport system substrate-binding protein
MRHAYHAEKKQAFEALAAQIDRRVTDEAPLIPFTLPSGTLIVSARAGNYQYNPQWGVLLDQLWVK